MGGSDFDGWGPDYVRSFGKAGGFMPPAEPKMVDRHPDKRQSNSAQEIVPKREGYVEILAVRGLGAIHVSMEADPKTGRFIPANLGKISAFSDQMLQFGLEAEENAPK